MNLNKLLITVVFAVSAAFAQSWSQPVRETDREARSAVRGSCSGHIQANHNTGTGTCTMTLPNDQQAQAVPAGKHLVVEDVSAFCETASGEVIGRLALYVYPPAPGLPWAKYVPLASQGTTAGRTWRAASIPARFYATPGSTLGLTLFSGTPVEAMASCNLHFAGHLVNTQ